MKTGCLKSTTSNLMEQTVRRTSAFGLVILPAFFLLGCNREPGAATSDQLPDPLPPAQASIQIEKTFAASTNDWTKNTVKVAVQALRDKQYDVAYAALQQLKISGRLTPEEDMAVRNAILGNSVAGIKAMERGDTNAAEMMKNIR
jgi:hypothetical protein